MRGKLITLEGVEGVGKSTVVADLANYLTHQQVTFIQTREPGGTEIAEAIRGLLLQSYQERMCPETELLLFFAGRAQHVKHLIVPALLAGTAVLCDRFADASYAYQCGGRQIPRQHFEHLEQWLLADLRPDLTLLLDAPVNIGRARIRARSHVDRIEAEPDTFFRRIREAYLERAQAEPQRYVVIDATQPLAAVQAHARRAVAHCLELSDE